MTVFKNPGFGDAIASGFQAFMGNPVRRAQTLASLAGARRNVAAAEVDEQFTGQNADLVSAMQSGDFSAALAHAAGTGARHSGADLPTLISSALGLPGAGTTADQRGVFQVAGGIQKQSDTETGFAEGLANAVKRSRIAAGPGYARVAELRRQFENALVETVDPETGQAVLVPRSQANGAIPVVSKADAQGGIISAAADALLGGTASPMVAKMADAMLSDRRAPRNYITPDGARGTTLDGMTDATTNTPLPQGSQTFTGAVQSDDAAAFTTSTQSGLEGDQIAAGDFFTTSDALSKNIAENPTSVGAVGRVRRLLQDVGQQSRLFGGVFGGDLDQKYVQAMSDLGQAGINFDPSINEIDQAATLLAYQAAAAVARQEGRGLSDQDFKIFRGVVGDPNALLASPASLQARIGQLERMVEARVGSRSDALIRGSVSTPERPEGTPAPSGPTRLRFNPETGKIE